jgi:hypothetical protein
LAYAFVADLCALHVRSFRSCALQGLRAGDGAHVPLFFFLFFFRLHALPCLYVIRGLARLGYGLAARLPVLDRCRSAIYARWPGSSSRLIFFFYYFFSSSSSCLSPLLRRQYSSTTTIYNYVHRLRTRYDHG